jgi:hypothetical protein
MSSAYKDKLRKHPGGVFQGDLLEYLDDIKTATLTHALRVGNLQGGASIGSQQVLANGASDGGATLAYIIDGVSYASAATEVAFTATTHDIAVSKEKKFVVSINANGSLWLNASAAADTGECVDPTDVPSTHAVLGYFTILCGATTAFTAGTTTLDATATTTGITVTYSNMAFDPALVSRLDDNLVIS